MIVLVALTVGLVIWVVGWAFGIKSIDAFMITALLTVSAAAFRMVKPYLDQIMRRKPAQPARGRA